MRSWRSPDGGNLSQFAALRAFQLVAAATFVLAAWRVLGHLPYRIDVEVYRMGAQAWLNGRPLYDDGALFHTSIGLNLPFTYPPLAAIVFCPIGWLSFPAGSVVITLVTLVLLVASTAVVLTALQVWSVPARFWLAVAVTGLAVIHLEPIQSNLAFGQINVVLMTLVIADCLPRRTPWPRGVLLGLAIALKLTPAVFLLYFVLRRDTRAALTAVGSFVVASLAGFVLAWRDSMQYWTATVRHTNRIGSAALNTNQNVAGALARLPLGGAEQFVVWTIGCLAVLAVTVWAARRVLRAGEQVLALVCIALFGLLVSPVSWSHHWVWVLPTLLTTGVLACRRRNAALAALTAAGVVLMVWTPIDLLPEHREWTASWWRQLVGASYVWWALAVIVVAGATVGTRMPDRPHWLDQLATTVTQ
ncbi:MAG TPA: glycosyltransferase 87 family protein [Mycobacterium sp.]|nr:glycosyltransferase 87 family protein [Mycobacterium sp.]